MKIFSANSARFYGSQIQEIEKGFVELGHEITNLIDQADIVYQNNAPFASLIEDKHRGVIKGKLIGVVLDVPEHLPTFDYAAQRAELVQLDVICTISQFVQGQIKRIYGLDSHVIYNPTKPVSLLGDLDRATPNLFASVGRRGDPNKNSAVGFHALQILGVPESDVALVGSEPGWGTFIGVLADANLNGLYNQVDFVLALGTIEGMGLPAIEAMATGAIPIIHRGLSTREEFFPSSLFPEYLSVDCTPESVARFIAQFMNNDERKREFKQRLYTHYQSNWAGKLTGRAVAKAIVKVYESIT